MSETPSTLGFVAPAHLKLARILVACIAAAILAIGLFDRFRTDQSEKKRTAEAAIPAVKVITLSPALPTSTLSLPGDIEAYYVAPVYARVTGYLRHWYVDIGARVKKGEIIADVDAPDLDQQLDAARSNLRLAIANEDLAAIEDKRYLALQKENAIAQELVDEKVGTYKADIAATQSARATLNQLLAEDSFKQIVAPFDGIVTTRSTDVGALITVGLPTETPLFTIADEHRLRIYVHVPQNESAAIRPGTTATFVVPQYPNKTFHAVLVTTAQAIDAPSGTLNLEFEAQNPDGTLITGEYADMRIIVSGTAGAVTVPASALMFGNQGMTVATINARSHVVIKSVTVGLDNGSTVEVTNGISTKDRVVDNPPDSLRNDDVVRLVNNAQ
jgi:RND family efflux transporter MFP subunit